MIYEERIPTKGETFLIYFCVLHGLRFFNFRPYLELGYFVDVVDMLLCLYFAFIFLKQNKSVYKSKAYDSVKWFYVLILTSFPIAYFSNEQTIFHSLWGLSSSYLYIGLFFYLVDKKYPINKLERLFWVLTIGYILAWTLCLFQSPNNIFGCNVLIDSEDAVEKMQQSIEDRGVNRFYMTGGDYVSLGLLYIFSNRKQIKHKYLIIIILMFYTILRATRGPITFTIVSSLLAFFISSRFSAKKMIALTVGCIIMVFVSLQFDFTGNIINSMINTTQNEVAEQGSDDVRLLSLTYYFTEFNEGSILPTIIGNGVCIGGNFTQKINSAAMVGLHPSDIEYILWYLYFGVLGLIVLFYWGISFIKLRTGQEGLYLKMFLLYIFLVMILGSHFALEVPMIAIVCYILWVKNYQYNRIS